MEHDYSLYETEFLKEQMDILLLKSSNEPRGKLIVEIARELANRGYPGFFIGPYDVVYVSN
jgi:hypothetical protein